MRWKLVVVLCGLFLIAGCLIFLGRTSGQTSASQSRITQAVDETLLTILRGNTHPFARPEFDRGIAPPDLPEERMLLVLRASPEQEAAALKFHADLQDKSSPNYHKWLTPEEFGQRFGVSDADIQTISSWLQLHGFTVNEVAKGRNLIEFSGTAGQVSAAFHTDIHSYVVNGEQRWANASDPAIPTALVPAVAGVASLHNFPRKPASHFVGNFRKMKSTGEVIRLQKDFTTGTCNGLQTPNNCFLVGPGDYAAIYNLNPLYLLNPSPINGTGVAIAIVAQTDINPSDFQNFRSLFGLSAGNLRRVFNGTNPGIVDPGDEGESDLDTQWSSSVAREATIDLVISASTNASNGVDLSAAYIVANANTPAIFPTKPAVLSESYGACELQLGQAGNAMFGDPATGLWSEATAEGLTVVVSAGDSGSAGCANPNPNITTEQPDTVGLNVSGLASTPFNIAVGGTDFNQMTNATAFWNTSNTTDALGVKQVSAMGYIPETTWNDSCANLIWGQAGFSVNPETNCNNTTVSPSFILPEGGGGGISNCTNSNGNTASSCSGGYAKPAWQTALTPADGKRDVPDVSLFAGAGLLGSFYVVCQQDQNPGQVPCSLSNVNDFQGFGGTSVAAQTFAGIMALVVQAHGAQGLANPKLYSIAGGAGATCASAANPDLNNCTFFDITTGNIEAPCVLNVAQDCSATTPAAVPVASHRPSKIAAWILPALLALCVSIVPFAVHVHRRNWMKAFGLCALAFALVFIACGGGGGGGGVGAATHFVVSVPNSATAGSAFNFTVTALTASNTTATGYTGTAHFTSSDGAAVLPVNSTLTNGAGTFSATLKTNGAQTITATDTVTMSIAGVSGTITVTGAVGAATHFVVSVPNSATAGSAFNVTVTAKDSSNNTATGYSGTVHFTSSDAQAILPADSTLTNGVGTFSSTLKTNGAQTITATDTTTASITGTSGTITVGAVAATHFMVSAPATAAAGSAFNFTVTALTASNTTATGYTGTAHFTSSDGAAVLPVNSTLTNGAGTFSATLKTNGAQTITATDTTTASITGMSGTITVTGEQLNGILNGYSAKAGYDLATGLGSVNANKLVNNPAW